MIVFNLSLALPSFRGDPSVVAPIFLVALWCFLFVRVMISFISNYSFLSSWGDMRRRDWSTSLLHPSQGKYKSYQSPGRPGRNNPCLRQMRGQPSVQHRYTWATGIGGVLTSDIFPSNSLTLPDTPSDRESLWGCWYHKIKIRCKA